MMIVGMHLRTQQVISQMDPQFYFNKIEDSYYVKKTQQVINNSIHNSYRSQTRG